MANKYGIYGAAFNGDGTTSSEAASDGAAGAWKLDQVAGDILQGTTPTYGTLSPGDVVYIRSKTGNGANADKTFTVTVAQTIGNANATEAAPITWILDNGVTWSGIDGVIEWDYTGGAPPSPLVTMRSWNRFIALSADAFYIDYNVADPNTKTLLSLGTGCHAKNWLLDNRERTGSYQTISVYLNSSIAENCKVICGRLSGAYPFAVSANTHAIVINPLVELTYTATPSYNSGAVFSSSQGSNRGGKITVIGGAIGGAAADDGYAAVVTPGASVWNAEFEIFGLQFPKQMPFTTENWVQYYNLRASCIGADEGYGSVFAEPWGVIDSRNTTYNYPVLNATMPDSAATPWSWKLFAQKAGISSPATLKIGKLYTSAAAAKTVTLELLASDTFDIALLDMSRIWMTVTYTKDSDDSLVTETTKTDVIGTTLDTSSTSWDKTDWGVVTFDKYKLSLTTANAIKQDTMVIATLFWSSIASSANEQVIICPDLQLT